MNFDGKYCKSGFHKPFQLLFDAAEYFQKESIFIGQNQLLESIFLSNKPLKKLIQCPKILKKSFR
jgi:hypothetical protein